MKHLHKKGVWSDIKEAVLAIAILCACLYLVWAYILHGIVPTQNTLQQCTALTGNGGQCKSICDESEMAFQGLGCTGKNNICCVRKNQNANDVMLPSGYGGDTNYDFEVTSIDFGILPSGCSPDANGNAVGNTVICDPNRPYQIPIQIKVINLYKSIDVYANPVIVINGNGDNILVGKYPGPKVKLTAASTTTPISGDATEQTLTTTISVAAAQTAKDEYLEIYAYATCDLTVCKKTDDPAMRGIFNTNSKAVLTVSFETKT